MNQSNYELEIAYSNRKAFHYPPDLKAAIEILKKDEYAILNVTTQSPTNAEMVDLMQITQKDLKGKTFEGIEATINKFANEAKNASNS